MIATKCSGTLLIVDDLEDVRAALGRYFKLYFGQVYVAATPAEAEECLREHHPDYLLCDYWLGDDHPPATALIPRWRDEYPSLKRVALMTGTKASALGQTQRVDRIFDKPLDLDRVLAFFSEEEHQQR